VYPSVARKKIRNELEVKGDKVAFRRTTAERTGRQEIEKKRDRKFPGIVANACACAIEKALEKSGLDWTIARPPRLTPKPYKGKYRVREGHLPPFGFSISHADVADFMIVVENRSLIGKVVGVCS
jgi:hypothetical protein